VLQDVKHEDLIPPKYLVQLSGTVYSLFLIEPLTSDYFFVVRLLRKDLLEGVQGYEGPDDLFAQWFPRAPNLERSVKHLLPEPGVFVSDAPDAAQYNSFENRSLQTIALAAYPILYSLFEWSKVRKPQTQGQGLKTDPISPLKKTPSQIPPTESVASNAPSRSGGADENAASSRHYPAGSTRQVMMGGVMTTRGRGKQFWAVDPNMFDLCQTLYDQPTSKVWIAIRRVDGVQVVVKWCTRKSALRTLQAHLALNGIRCSVSVCLCQGKL